MGLYLGLIRLAIVLSNVYWSFKSLKPPRLSRRGDAPTARAIAARKREIKACLSVWIIWGCWIHAERVCDRSIGILIPFYEDMKAIFLSVFFLCRAAVAEPILLYFLRPLIKPYIVTIDWGLDLFTFFAGLITYLLCLPYRYVRTWMSPQIEDDSRETTAHEHGPLEDVPSNARGVASGRVAINAAEESGRNTRRPALPAPSNGSRIGIRSSHALPVPQAVQTVIAPPATRVTSDGAVGTRQRRRGVEDEDHHPFERRHVVVPPARSAPPRQPSFDKSLRSRPNVLSAVEDANGQAPRGVRQPLPQTEIPIEHALSTLNPYQPPTSRDLSQPPIATQHVYPPTTYSPQLPGAFRQNLSPSPGPPPPLYPPKTALAQQPLNKTAMGTEMNVAEPAGPSSTSAQKAAPVAVPTERREPSLGQRRSQYLASARQGRSNVATDAAIKDTGPRSRKASETGTQSRIAPRTQDEAPPSESDVAPVLRKRNSRVISAVKPRPLKSQKSSASLKEGRKTSGYGSIAPVAMNGTSEIPSDSAKIGAGNNGAAKAYHPGNHVVSGVVDGRESAKPEIVLESSPTLSDDDTASVSAKKRRVGQDGDKVQRRKVDGVSSDSDSDASGWAALDELKTPMKRPRHVPKPIVISPPAKPQNSPSIFQAEDSTIQSTPISLPTISTFPSPSMPQFGYMATRADDFPSEPLRRGERKGNVPPIVTTSKTRNIARAAAARRFATTPAPRLGIAGVDPIGITGARNAPPPQPEGGGARGRHTAKSRGTRT